MDALTRATAGAAPVTVWWMPLKHSKACLQLYAQARLRMEDAEWKRGTWTWKDPAVDARCECQL